MPTDAEIIKELEKKVKYLEGRVDEFENGDSSLYYAVQRKMKELSKILNKHKLDEIDIDDRNNKSFERLSGILEKCEKYALSATALGSRFGVTPPESENKIGIIRTITTPESIADGIGNPAGQRN